MIECPYCDTLNRKGSKFCSHCGHRLDSVSVVHCPACRGPNPASMSACRFCGASLVSTGHEDRTDIPTEPVERSVDSQPGSALPPRPELPQWLYQQAASNIEAPEGKTSSVSLQAKVDEEGSKYLKGITGALPAKDGWLASVISSYLAQRAQK
jgi:hypothetical protein